MKSIRTEDSAGCVLGHDITRIIPGIEKGPVFKKGHIIKTEDIPVLLSVGKENIYVYEKTEGMLHEDEAAQVLKDIACKDADNLRFSGPSEGKIEIISMIDGLLEVNSKALLAINSIDGLMMATRKGNTPVKAGDRLAGTRIIPLVIEETVLEKAKKAAGGEPVLKVLPYNKTVYSMVVTGNEVAKGLIKDAFSPVLERKLGEYGADCRQKTILSDDSKAIKKAIREGIENGDDLILVTGGMSVDPDDRTPLAIRESTDGVVSYGAPVLPGAMFMLAYAFSEGRRIPVMGLPGCVMYAKRTIFDLVLPRILAGQVLSKEDLTGYGEGGLCLSCDVCTWPNCGFGK